MPPADRPNLGTPFPHLFRLLRFLSFRPEEVKGNFLSGRWERLGKTRTEFLFTSKVENS